MKKVSLKVENETFLYPRDHKNNTLRSVVCVLNRDGLLFSGMAYAGPDDQYVRAIGRQISKKRALEAYKRYLANCKKRDKKTKKKVK